MRNINYIVLHCTATPQNAKIESIQKYWKETLKWNSPGYHYIIEPDGSIQQLQLIDKPTNGVAGYNSSSIHISYIGGIDEKGRAIDNRTPLQIKSMIGVIIWLKKLFTEAKIQGHRDFPNVKKECPSFDVAAWLKLVGIAN